MTTPPLCPICHKPATREHKPFCSRRCREVDLGRWFGEDYRLPTAEIPTDDSGSE
ncbi:MULTISPECIES: DNA gyrase inhibitor YacG [Acidiphilium]|uniref:DNA gyrase inhibitor YacG n=1 Tax=Acidiphilium iwatense TaxID=768198 RepID=A0ABS9DTL3_9PROT|nr:MULTISPECIES: DNA gyrase inhibitor YacG [Acidiphilium]MCF3945071.1 DNA gyrase inhibitor YacG [Acidiphilium iwatense]